MVPIDASSATLSGQPPTAIQSAGNAAVPALTEVSPAWLGLLDVQLSEPWPVQQHDLPLRLAEEAENGLVVKHRKRARNRLQREPEIIGDIAAAHRQRHDAGGRQTAVHLQQERRDPLQRGLA